MSDDFKYTPHEYKLYEAENYSSKEKIEHFIESYRTALEPNTQTNPKSQIIPKTSLPALGDVLEQVGNIQYYIEGTHENDTIYSYKAASNVIDAKEGDDSIYGEEGNDIMLGGTGNDTIASAAGDDTIFTGDNNDVAFGQSGNDKIYGQRGDDILSGNENDDTVDGGSGNDILYMATGNDELYGGVNNDVFALASSKTRKDLYNQESPLTGITRIKDFNRNEDKIRIESTLAESLKNATFESDGTSTIIKFKDQAGEFSDFSIIVENVTDININDFVITEL